MGNFVFWLLWYGGAAVLGAVIAEVDMRYIRRKIDRERKGK